jgi:hypothetical protein
MHPNSDTASGRSRQDTTESSARPQGDTHHGDLMAKPGVIYEYEKITGYLDASGADAAFINKDVA